MRPLDENAPAAPDAEPAAPEPAGPSPARPSAAVRVTPLAEGPLLVEGPVEVVLPDGTVRRSDRPVVALCRCRRSLRDPFCDTSHRRRSRAARRTARSEDPDSEETTP
ncbi:CDGSH iron-sulfur domain-containing protein [Streptomyces griseus]|uniref:CDGSH iron-sulfur domain-containing protein n=1 Tax=Streptomyces griseus TaxID=1911 RepID=UPI00099DE8B4|nr:CDGSH iron-sulfur domain-containing protein [Streptomyces griseus]